MENFGVQLKNIYINNYIELKTTFFFDWYLLVFITRIHRNIKLLDKNH